MSEQLAPEVRFEGFKDAWAEREVGRLGAFLKGSGYSKADVGTGRSPLFLYGRLYTKYELGVRNVDTFTALRPNSLISRGNEVLVPGSGETPEDIAVACALLQPGVAIGGDLNVIRPNTQTDPTCLALTLSHGRAKSALSRRAQGKSVVHLHNSALQELLIRQPSLREQQAIGSLFADLEASIDQHRRRHLQLKQTKASLMERMFPAPGETMPQVRFDGFDGEWLERRLGNLGPTYGGLSGKQGADFGHGSGRYVPYLQVMSHALIYDATGFGVIEVDPKQREVRTGDALFTISSETPEEVGMAAVWLGTGSNIYLNSFCFGLRPVLSHDSRFFAYALRSDAVREQLVLLAQGISRFNISKKRAMDTRVLFPPTLGEQQAIGAFFAKLEALIEAEQQRVEKLQQVKASLLQKMFV